MKAGESSFIQMDLNAPLPRDFLISVIHVGKKKALKQICRMSLNTGFLKSDKDKVVSYLDFSVKTLDPC